MKEYLFVFRGGRDQVAEESPEQMQIHMQKWSVWMEGLAKEGKLIGGQPLQKEGKVVAKGGKMITDGPFTEGKEVVGGYLIVKAKDIDGAVEISKGCPIYEFDGTTEVRELIPM
ncbi:MAG: YciI family protein [Cyclobacteriaceae bacterium]